MQPSRSLPSGSRPSPAPRLGCQVAMVGVTGSWTNQSCPGDEYLPFEPSSSPLGHSKVAQRERGGSCTDLFILAQSCWVDRCIALCALQSSAQQREGEREREATAPSQLLPLLPCCHRPKTILAFPVASGLLKAGPVGPKPSTFHAESGSISFVTIRLTVSEIISHKVKPKRIL